VANIKSQIKRNRQNPARERRNKSVQTALKTYAKKVRTVGSTDPEAAQVELRRASREIDRAVSKGALNKRAAGRRKSRLARAANAGRPSS